MNQESSATDFNAKRDIKVLLAYFYTVNSFRVEIFFSSWVTSLATFDNTFCYQDKRVTTESAAFFTAPPCADKWRDMRLMLGSVSITVPLIV